MARLEMVCGLTRDRQLRSPSSSSTSSATQSSRACGGGQARRRVGAASRAAAWLRIVKGSKATTALAGPCCGSQQQGCCDTQTARAAAAGAGPGARTLCATQAQQRRQSYQAAAPLTLTSGVSCTPCLNIWLKLHTVLVSSCGPNWRSMPSAQRASALSSSGCKPCRGATAPSASRPSAVPRNESRPQCSCHVLPASTSRARSAGHAGWTDATQVQGQQQQPAGNHEQLDGG